MFSRLDKYQGHVTAADLWKTAALLLMTVDHVGWLFWPDELWLRAVGRVCVPIWMVLVGYHYDGRTRPIVLGALCVTLINLATNQPLFSLNILWTIVICRWMLNHGVIQKAIETQPLGLTIAIIVFTPITLFFFEYGGQALLFAMVGYMLRQGQRDDRVITCAVLGSLFFLLLQQHIFEFSVAHMCVIAAGISMVWYGLWRYEPKSYGTKAPLISTFTKMGGRYTLEYYALHKLILQAIAAYIIGHEAMQFTLY